VDLLERRVPLTAIPGENVTSRPKTLKSCIVSIVYFDGGGQEAVFAVPPEILADDRGHRCPRAPPVEILGTPVSFSAV